MDETGHILDLMVPTFQWEEADYSQGSSNSAITRIPGEALKIYVFLDLSLNPDSLNQILWGLGLGTSIFQSPLSASMCSWI